MFLVSVHYYRISCLCVCCWPTRFTQPRIGTLLQVLGFDILLLKDLRPVLLEVNSNPSLSIMGEQEVAPGIVEYIPSIKDEEVKRALIRDTLILIAPKNKKTRRRRVYRQSIVKV